MERELRACRDCGAEPGTEHGGCDIARCLYTGHQRIQCPYYISPDWPPDEVAEALAERADMSGDTPYDEWRRSVPPHDDCGRDVWTGEYPGAAECREYGLWAVFVPNGNPSWRPVSAGTPGATEDLNRLVVEGRWDREAKRWRWPAGR